MRGDDRRSGSLFSYVDIEKQVHADHPLRTIKTLVDEAATTFTKNRDRLLEGAIAHRFLAGVLAIPRLKRLLSSDHFSVDGTLIEAWASMKSFSRRMTPQVIRRPTLRRRAAMPRSARRAATTPCQHHDPDARLYRKGRGREAKLS